LCKARSDDRRTLFVWPAIAGEDDRRIMVAFHFPKDRTGLLIVDPYNDFLSEGGKLFERAQAIIESVGLLDHMRAIVDAARAAAIPIFFVPHHRSVPGDFHHWKFTTPYQQGADRLQMFAVDSWGGEWHPDFIPQAGDVIVKEHWSSGFAGTDLDLQLRQHGIQYIVLIGMIANTCLEATGRYGMELGYHVTLVRDATAAFTAEAMRTAHDINGPTYAHAILTTAELLPAFATPT
jgi:nicotinamidase-related amidase